MTSPTIDIPASSALWRMAAPLRQQVVTLLRDAIVAGDYRPGERLVERVLCERLQVSRTVVREALRQLESEGLVNVEPNRGPVVTTLSAAEVADLYEAREVVESTVARLFAARATAVQREELAAQFAAMEAAVDAGDIKTQLTAKDAYYETLQRGAANDTLRRMLEAIHSRTSRARRLSLGSSGRGPKMLAEMRVLTAAAVAGDQEATATASVAHVRSAGEAALAAIGAATRRDAAGG